MPIIGVLSGKGLLLHLLFYVLCRYSSEKDKAGQSKCLRVAAIKVSARESDNSNMFTTELEEKQGVYKDPCHGDSGAPLMYQDPPSSRWIVLGL